MNASLHFFKTLFLIPEFTKSYLVCHLIFLFGSSSHFQQTVFQNISKEENSLNNKLLVKESPVFVHISGGLSNIISIIAICPNVHPTRNWSLVTIDTWGKLLILQ